MTQRWLDAPTEDAVRAAVSVVLPDAAALVVSFTKTVAAGNEWRRATARLGDEYVVKFAWTQEACALLEREIAIHTELERAAPDVPQPALVATSQLPLLLIRRFVPGRPGPWGNEATSMSEGARKVMAAQMARVLANLHRHDLVPTAQRLGLVDPEAQSDTEGLLEEFLPLITPEHADRVRATCAWVDEVLREPTERVLLHGDLHSFNIVFDQDWSDVLAVLDFESASLGDPAFDFRYLPAQQPKLQVLCDVLEVYEQRARRSVPLERVLAWHALTALGDAMWRTQAGVEIPGGGDADHAVDALDGLFALAGVRP